MAEETIREFVTRWGFVVDDKPLERMERQIDSIIGTAKRLAFAFTGSAFGLGALIREAGKAEQTMVAFTTMLNSAEKAREVLGELAAFAARTPFTLEGIEQSAKQLLAVGIGADDLIPTLKALGDVAAGLSVPLDRLVMNLGQVRSQGKLTGRDLKDFQLAGVPILAQLAKNLNKTEAEINEMVSRGKISFDDTIKAFQAMSGEGGRFANLMTKQSTTLFGMLSNLQDWAQQFARDIGGTLLPELKEVLSSAMEFLNVNRELIKSKVADFFRGLAFFIKETWKFTTALASRLSFVVEAFGGWEAVIRRLTIAILFMLGLKLTLALGNMGLAAFAVAKNLALMVTGFNTAGRAAFMFQLKAVALPLAIGAAILGLLLIIEDFIVFMQGGESFMGRFFDAKDFDKGMGKFEKKVEEFVKRVVTKISDFFTSPDFADERAKVMKALETMFNVGGIVLKGLAEVGVTIGRAIVGGFVSAFVEKFPKAAKALGLSAGTEADARDDSFAGHAQAMADIVNSDASPASKAAMLGRLQDKYNLDHGLPARIGAPAAGGAGGGPVSVTQNITIDASGMTPEQAEPVITRALENANKISWRATLRDFRSVIEE